jgi:plasmid stability protein
MEEEAREILKNALESEQPVKKNLAESIHKLFAPLGGVDLTLPEREPMRRPPKFK